MAAIKLRLKKIWLRFRMWIAGLLIAVGVIVMPIVVATPVEFTYTPATEYEDGTPLPIEEIAETRLKCRPSDNDPFEVVASEPGADGNFQPDLAPGIWECVATHVAINSMESANSNAVVRPVLPNVPPRAPTLNP